MHKVFKPLFAFHTMNKKQDETWRGGSTELCYVVTEHDEGGCSIYHIPQSAITDVELNKLKNFDSKTMCERWEAQVERGQNKPRGAWADYAYELLVNKTVACRPIRFAGPTEHLYIFNMCD